MCSVTCPPGPHSPPLPSPPWLQASLADQSCCPGPCPHPPGPCQQAPPGHVSPTPHTDSATQHTPTPTPFLNCSKAPLLIFEECSIYFWTAQHSTRGRSRITLHRRMEERQTDTKVFGLPDWVIEKSTFSSETISTMCHGCSFALLILKCWTC